MVYVIYVLTFVDASCILPLLTHAVGLYREWSRDQARGHHSNQAAIAQVLIPARNRGR